MNGSINEKCPSKENNLCRIDGCLNINNLSTNHDKTCHLQYNQWIYKYLDAIRPENISSIQKNKVEFTNNLLRLSENYSGVSILNKVVCKLYSLIYREKRLSIQTFTTFSQESLISKSNSVKLDFLIDVYSFICNNLNSLTNNLISYHKLIKSENAANVKDVSSPTSFNNVKNRHTWHQNLNYVAIRLLKAKVMKTKAYLENLTTRKYSDSVIMAVMQYYTRRCKTVLDRIINILFILEQGRDDTNPNDVLSPPIIVIYKVNHFL